MSRKLALIIGNYEYQDTGLAQLKSPGLDAHDFAGALRSSEIGAFDEVSTLLNEAEANVRRAIARFFVNKKPDDLLLLYFSGHGVRDEQGHLYLAVKDTDRALLSATAIPAAFITGQMDASRSRRQVLILDCCNSGAFDRLTKSGGTGISIGTASAFEGVGYGRVVLTATDATQYAWEGDQAVGEAENSVFTRYLVKGLETGEADIDNDGLITLDELYDYVYAHVVSETPKQTPGKWSYKQQGDLVIARNPHPMVKAVPLPGDLQQSLEDLRPWVREGAVRELERLLNGSLPGLALTAHDALLKLKDDDSRRVSQAAADVLAKYEAQQDREREKEKAEAERLAQQNAQAERLAREAQAEAERKEEAERLTAQAKRMEEERLAAQRAEQERRVRDAQRAEADRLAREKAEQEQRAREAAERAEAERKAKEESERLATQAKRAEQERLAREKAEAELRTWREAERTAREEAKTDAGAPTRATPALELQPGNALSAIIAWARNRWFPLALLAVSWWLGIGIQMVFWDWSIYDAGWLVGGLVGGTAIVAALRLAGTQTGVMPAGLIIGSWILSQVVAINVYAYNNNSLGLDESLALGQAIGGALGGFGTSLALGWAGYARERRRLAIIVAGWAIAWALSAWIGLGVTNAFGDDPREGAKHLILNLISIDSDVAYTLGTWLANVAVSAAYALAGVLGGGAMLRQLDEARSSAGGQAVGTTVIPRQGIAFVEASWLPILITTIGWGIGRGLMQLLLPDDLEPQSLVWFANWVLGGAIGGVITGLALRRVEPAFHWDRIARVAGGWASGWAMSWMVGATVWTFASDFKLTIAWQVPSEIGMAIGGMIGGYILGAVWRGLSPTMSRQRVWTLSGGWAASWVLANYIASQIYNDHGWVIGWSFGGMVGGLIGGAVTFWQLSEARANVGLPTAQPVAAPRQMVIPLQAMWRSILLIALGWGIARGIGHGAYLLLNTLLPEDVFSNLLDLTSWVGSGAIGGWITWLALRRIEPAFGRNQILALAGGWAGGWAISWTASDAVWSFVSDLNKFDIEVNSQLPSAMGLAAGGAIGGYLLGTIWRGHIAPLRRQQVLIISLAWAVGWVIANSIRWTIIGFDDSSSINWLVGWSLGGFAAGLIGGAVTFWQLRQSHPS